MSGPRVVPWVRPGGRSPGNVQTRTEDPSRRRLLEEEWQEILSRVYGEPFPLREMDILVQIDNIQVSRDMKKKLSESC